MLWTLARILSPRTEEDFGEMLGKSAVLIEGESDKFSELVSWPTVNDLLGFRALSFPRLHLSKAGNTLPEHTYFRKSQEGFPRLLVGSFNALVRDGATAIIESVHELHPPLLSLCRDIEHALMLPAKMSLLISWSEAASGGSRYNGHEMLVLQLCGTTRWRIWAPTTPCPTANGHQCDEPASEPRWHPAVLKAGSVAYIPRGWWWSTETAAGQASLQLIVAFRNPTGLDVVGRFVDQLPTNEFLRRDSPRSEDVESHGRFMAMIQTELVRALGEPGVLLGFEKDMWSMCEQLSYFSLPWSVSLELGKTSRDLRVISLVRFLGEHSVYYSENEDEVEVVHDGAIMRLTPTLGLVLKSVEAGTTVGLDEVMRRCQGRMPPEVASAALVELAYRGLIGLMDVSNSS